MELDIEAGQQLFEKLQPVCSRLAKDQSRDNVRSLCLALDGAPDPALQALQEYVLFPLRVILKQPKSLSDEVYTDVCGCIGKVLARTTVNRWEMCRDLFSSLSILLTSPVNFGTVSDVSEEMKSSIIKCLELLVKSTESRAIEPLYRLESLPMLGHLVSMLLDVAQRDRARHVRLHALHCLLALMQSHNKVEKSAARSLGDTFAAFLPGMSMGLCKIITADEKQGQMITVLAVEAWRRVVTLTMGDKSVFPNETKRKKETKTEEDRLAQLRVERNSDWVKSTSANLLILLKDIAGIRTHSSWKVRASLVDWASKLLTECHRSLEEAIPVLLEVLVGLISDDYDGVASKARKAVESFSQSHMHGESERTLVEILEDNLYSLATSLPRQMRTADDTQKLSILNLLTGYLQLLGPHTCSLVRSMSHLKRLSTALVQVLEFDCTDIKITEDVSFITGHGASALLPSHTSMLQRPRKYFRHFSDDQILDKLLHTCHLLGYYGDIEILVDHFLDVFHETKVYRMPVTLILNEMMVGTVTVDDSAKFHSDVGSKEQEQLKALVRMLVEEYLMPANFNLKTSNVDETEGLLSPLNKLSYSQLTLTPDSQPIASLNANVLQLCLFIEGFGKFSQVLGTEFAPLLMMVLYPLMEKLGDEKAFISTTAYLSLTQISSHCHYSSVDKLLQANSDYLVNAVSLKLRHLRHNPRAPLVLKVTLQYSSAELLPLVHDTIQEVLSTLDQYYGENAVMFMNVLHALVLAVEKWYPPSKHENDRLFATEKPVRCSEDVVEFMKDHHSARLVSEGDVEEEDAVEAGEDGGLSEEPQEDIPSEPPTHVSTVKEVLVRSKHLLSSGNPRLRLLVLDTISHAASALKDHQDVLLPLVHQLWPPFVERFQDEERLVTLKAFQTLLCLAEVCGDFIRKRTVTGVIPKLLRFLLSQAQTSIKVGPAYTFTAAFKLQLALLSDLGTLAPFLGLEGSDVESVLRPCLPYLSSRQPAPLQQAAVRTLKKISALEPDLVWLLLNQIYCPIDYLPPSQDLPHIKFGDSSKKRTEYTDNVRDLLTTLS